MRGIPRETATHEEDLPHQFSDQEVARSCDVCSSSLDDPRHRSWEAMRVAARERANEDVIPREFG